jgi:hypothetical protein
MEQSEKGLLLLQVQMKIELSLPPQMQKFFGVMIPI